MAATISDLANGTGTTSTTTVVTGATVTAAIGDWLVVIVAGDNAGGGGAASLTTVVDSDGVNTYTNRALINYDPIGASVGATLGIYTCQVTATLSSDTITANFSPATTAKAIQVYKVVAGTGEVVSFIAADATGSTGSATSHTAATISVSSGRIIFGAAAIETNTAVTGDADTTNGNWSTVITRLANVSATDLSSMTCSSQYKTVTATGNQSWACTTGVAKDSARSYVVLASEKILDATTPGSYSLTGTDAATRRNLPMAADVGSYSMAGVDATLTKGVVNAYVISVGDDDLLLETGDHLLLETSDLLLLEEQIGGTYVQTGTDASLNKGKFLAADLGTYVLTGTDAATTHQWKLDATTPASYALTGTDATLTKSSAAVFTLAADSGSYVLTGTDPSTLHAWRITAGDETFADLLLETGDFLLLETGDKLVLEETGIAGGVYALTGSDVALSTAANKQIVADPGSYLLTGTDAATTHQWKLDATTAGAYALTGTDATLRHGWRLDATVPGSYTLVSTDAATTHQWKLDATSAGAYALTGTDVTLTTTGAFAIAAESGSYLLIGTDVTLTLAAAKSIVADPGSYLLTGSPVTLTYQPAAPAIVVPTRGEWPERKRRRREYERTARETLRASLDRLFDGGEYDPLPEVFEQAIAAAEVVQLLPGLPLADLQAVTDLIARIQEMVRQRLLDEAQVEAATQMARQHLIDSIAIADEVYRRTRQNYLIKTLLLIAE